MELEVLHHHHHCSSTFLQNESKIWWWWWWWYVANCDECRLMREGRLREKGGCWIVCLCMWNGWWWTLSAQFLCAKKLGVSSWPLLTYWGQILEERENLTVRVRVASSWSVEVTNLLLEVRDAGKDFCSSVVL